MIKAVIFDCFGVIADENWKPYLRGLFPEDDARLRRALRLNQEVDAGRITYEDFLAQLSGITGVPASVIRGKIETHEADAALLGFIERELKPRYKLGLLSNVPANWLGRFLTPSQLALFDTIVLSYEVGAAKPDPHIYQIAAERLRLAPDQCAFIDDQPANCEGAVAAGMTAVCYAGLDQLQANLVRYFDGR